MFGGKNGLPGYRVRESKDNHLAYLSEMSQTNRRETASFGRRPKAKSRQLWSFPPAKRWEQNTFKKDVGRRVFFIKVCRWHGLCSSTSDLDLQKLLWRPAQNVQWLCANHIHDIDLDIRIWYGYIYIYLFTGKDIDHILWIYSVI